MYIEEFEHVDTSDSAASSASENFLADDGYASLGNHDDVAFPSKWLALQCVQIESVKSACLILRRDGIFRPVGIWPEASKPSNSVAMCADLAIAENRDIVTRSKNKNGDSGLFVTLACLLKKNGDTIGVISVDTHAADAEQLRFIKRQIQWGAAWLLIHYDRHYHQSIEFSGALAKAFSLMTLCFEYPGFQQASAAVASDWAAEMGLERVSIGFRKKNKTRLTAVSHNLAFDAKSIHIQKIVAALDEAIDQKAGLHFPSDPTRATTAAQAELLKISGNGSVYSLLIYAKYSAQGENIVGAVCLEHADADYFTEENRILHHQFSMLVGPLLEAKREQQNGWGARLLLGSRHARRLLGESYKAKALIATATILMALLSILPVDYRVAADAMVEGWTQRHMSASIDGYLYSSSIKAGDQVQQGQVLFVLDNRDLKLELLKWDNKREQLEKQQLAALSNRQVAQAGIIHSQVAQAQSQIEMLREQLERTEVKAPFDGVVVKGDLTQQIGSPVRRGDSLMQLAPLENYRVVLAIDERDISHIVHGQIGTLKLSALSDRVFDFELISVAPVGAVKDGVNTFKVEARLVNGDTAALRPGMQGKGKIRVGERTPVWIATHRFYEWLVIWFWSWWF